MKIRKDTHVTRPEGGDESIHLSRSNRRHGEYKLWKDDKKTITHGHKYITHGHTYHLLNL